MPVMKKNQLILRQLAENSTQNVQLTTINTETEPNETTSNITGPAITGGNIENTEEPKEENKEKEKEKKNE